jgi:uncharacterized protein YbbC (DUF1343 family)
LKKPDTVFAIDLIMKFILYSISLLILSCALKVDTDSTSVSELKNDAVHVPKRENCLTPLSENFKTGADQIIKVVELLRDKNVGLVGNPSSQINGVHLVDTLMAHKIALQRIFCPEHGFRGEGAAGAIINDSKDEKTGLPISSLYGENKKPALELLKGLDVLVFDIQDVGVRFYTYISTLHYIMEAAAEVGIEVLVLDRPNPNAHVIDGPILNPDFKSFIGMHAIPVCHGMTIGEYALMINGEGWLEKGLSCDLRIISCKEYTHSTRYFLPVKPSPNLPNYTSVILYPSLCFFEGTSVSVGRGTDNPFQVYGHPKLRGDGTFFTPEPRKEAPTPKLKGIRCNAYSFNDNDTENYICSAQLNLNSILEAHEVLGEDLFSRPNFFDLLAGSDNLRKQISEGKNEAQIRELWHDGLQEFKKTRSKYLLYP